MKSTKQIYHTKEFRITVIIAIIAMLGAFMFGLTMGIEITINKVARIASGFINVNESLIKQAVTQYANTIGGCYPSNMTYT